MSKAQDIVVIGNGMASARLVSRLIAANRRLRITLIGDEPEPAYNRILLSSLLAGEKHRGDLPLLDPALYREHGIRLMTDTRVTRIDRGRRVVVTSGGEQVGYDQLVLATGSRPFFPPVPGIGFDGVLGFRTLADVERLQRAAEQGGRAAVVGGGLLGLEAAAGLAKQGMAVTILQRDGWLMNRQLDEASARLLERELHERGIHVWLNAETLAVTGADQVEALHLADGRRLPVDLVVFAAGIRPNAELAREAGLACGRGVEVDDRLGTSDPAISAIGECCEHRGICYGLVVPVWQQADVLAHNLAHPDAEPLTYSGSAVTTRLKVNGIDVFSVGEFDGSDAEEQVFLDPGNRVYRRLRLRGDRLVGAVLYGDRRDASWYADLVEGGACVAPFRSQLMFGRSFCETAAGSTTRSAA